MKIDQTLAKKTRLTLSKLTIAMGLSGFLLFGCGGNSSSSDFQTSADDSDVALVPYSKGNSLSNAAFHKVMTYDMPSVQGTQTKATAMVMLPKTKMPNAGYKAVVWMHGTTGVGDTCAPSNNDINANFKVLAESLLASGYAIIAPDYEGLGTKGIHPYLNLKSEAQSAIYAVKAAQSALKDKLQGDWMSVGQSQGGHASLGVAQYAGDNTYYKGAVAAAPASSLGYIMAEVAPAALAQLAQAELAQQVPKDTAIAVYAELLAYAALTGVGIKAYQPDFDYTAIFKDRAKPFVKLAEGTTGDNGLCLDGMINAFKQDIGKFLQNNPDKTAIDYPGLVEDFQNNAVIAQFLKNNQPATQKLTTPVMIIQGVQDLAVPFLVTQSLQNQLKNLGTDVTFVPVEGASHTQAIVEKNDTLVEFIKTHMPAM